MPCSIAFTAVNGIVPLGQTDPSVLRVTGVAQLCGTGQVTVSSSITGTSSTVPVDANGRFRAELTITKTPAPHCNDLIQVRAECVGEATCFIEDQARPLVCCEIPTLFFQAVTPLGSLTPNQLSVQGVVHGCLTDQVVISSSVTATTGPITVDPHTGAFSAMLPTTSAVLCDDKITVTVACSTGTGCTRTEQDRLQCAGCYRAQVTLVTAACTGTPPRQPVTLNASIGIPAGAIQNFSWAFGDGAIGPSFTIDNSTGTAATTHAHAESHDYVPGTYTATLKIHPPPNECAEVSVTIVAQCTTAGCPSITVDPPLVSVQCTNGKRTVTWTSHITSPAAPAGATVVQWDYGDGSMGPAVVAAAGTTVHDTQTHDYLPGTYTARVKTVLPVGCPDTTTQVVVQPCSPPQCTLVVQGIAVQVGACDPVTGQRTVTVTGSVNNSSPSDLYYWQWDANPATVGLPAAMGTTQQHSYAAPGSGQTTYNITLTVVRSPTCISSVTRTVTIDGCGSGCPQIVDTLIGSPGVCTADRLRRKVTLDATISGSGVNQYIWDFGDGTTLTLPGSAGPQTTHEFVPGTYNVNLKAVGPGTCDANLAKQVVVDACCPTVTGISDSAAACAAGSALRPVTLTAQVAGTGITSFDWDFGDSTPGATSTTPVAPVHNYAAPGPFTAVVTAHAPNCPDVTASKSISIPPCPPGGGGGGGLSSCATLLWVALGFMLVGALIGIIGCVLIYFFVQVGLIMEAVGLSLFSTGAILFLIWWIVCRFLTACAVILAARDFVRALIVVFVFIAIILWIIQFFVPTFQGCAIAATLYGIAWGTILAILDWIADARRCLIPNPSGGPGPASSSGGLSSSDGSTRLRSSDFSRVAMTAQGPSGLGDVIKGATSAMGIQPCAPCQKRADQLNAMFPFKMTANPGVTGRSGMRS